MTVSSEHDSKIAERAALAAALRVRVGDVVDRIDELTRECGGVLEPVIEDTLRDAAELATIGVADAIALGVAAATLDPTAGSGATSFAELAAFPGASVNEVAKRCLRWRDCVATVLMDDAERLDISRAAIREALWLTLHSFDATLVRMCEAYECERQSMLGALLRGD